MINSLEIRPMIHAVSMVPYVCISDLRPHCRHTA